MVTQFDLNDDTTLAQKLSTIASFENACKNKAGQGCFKYSRAALLRSLRTVIDDGETLNMMTLGKVLMVAQGNISKTLGYRSIGLVYKGIVRLKKNEER